MGISSLRLASLAVAGGFMLLFTGCQQEDVPVADSQNLIITNDQTRAAGPSANGHGTIMLEDTPIDGVGFRHFTFHAKEKRNGSVEGNGVLTHIGGVRNLSFDIDCLTVDGTLAVMSGVITRDNQVPENVGLLCWFKVRDNGEGNNSDPDQITVLYAGTDPAVYDCAINYVDEAMYDIECGNVQVRE